MSEQNCPILSRLSQCPTVRDTWDRWDSTGSSAGLGYMGSACRMAVGMRSNSLISRSRALQCSWGKYGATSRVAGLCGTGRRCAPGGLR